VDRRNLDAFVARQKRRVDSGNVSGAEKADLDLGHLLILVVGTFLLPLGEG
jgi:hypothetical protein